MSRHSAEIIFWIGAVACAVAQIAILRAVFSPRLNVESQTTMPHSSRGAEILWAVIPAIGLAVLLAATWRAVH